jgi:hypothetical protein
MDNNAIHFPDKEVQEAHWQRKDDEYEEYLADLHRRQQDPDYIESCKQWLDETPPLCWGAEEIEEWQRQSERQGAE